MKVTVFIKTKPTENFTMPDFSIVIEGELAECKEMFAECQQLMVPPTYISSDAGILKVNPFRHREHSEQD